MININEKALLAHADLYFFTGLRNVFGNTRTPAQQDLLFGCKNYVNV